MSSSFLRAASTRSTDAGGGLKPTYRQKVSELSEKVVDSNPYSRLM